MKERENLIHYLQSLNDKEFNSLAKNVIRDNIIREIKKIREEEKETPENKNGIKAMKSIFNITEEDLK